MNQYIRPAASLVALAGWMSYRSPSTAISVLKYSAGVALATTTLTALGLWYFQTSLVYPASFPEGSRKNVPNPYDLAGIPFSSIPLTTPDKVKLASYLIYSRPQTEISKLSFSLRNKYADQKDPEEMRESPLTEEGKEWVKSRPTILMFHANAGNMGHRIPLAKAFWAKCGCNVFMISYRGYGASEGSPSEKGLRIDAATALSYIQSHPLLSQTPIIVYGQSIGGSVSIALASSSPQLSGLIIENSPFSIKSLIPAVMPIAAPFLFIPGILTEQWDAAQSVPRIRKDLPMLALVGEKDELVVATEMAALRKLREGAGGKLKWKTFKEGTHNDTYMQPGYWDAIKEFIDEEITNKSG